VNNSQGRRRFSRTLAAVAFLVAAALPAACSSGSAAKSGGTGSATHHYKIGVLIKDTTIPFFGRQIQGYKDAAAKYGWSVEILNGQGDNATQVGLIQQMIAKHDDMIMVTPGDSQAIIGALKQAKQAGIPVMAVNTAPSDAGDLLSFVGADNLAYGKALGDLVVQATGGTGNVAVVRGTLGDPPDTDRLKGLKEALSSHPGVKIIAQQSANWDASKALAVTQDFLTKYPKGQLSAIVDVGPEAAGGAKYAADSGRSEIKFVIGDFPSNVKDGVTAGYIYGAVDQDPHEQSTKAMAVAKDYLDGTNKNPPKTVFLPLPLVTKGNVSKFPAAW
jgi:ABC-type sugar transport system substrate-binding protein